MNIAQPTVIKDSSELVPGDIVLTYGMRVRLDEGTSRESNGELTYSWSGTVLNLDEVRDADVVPMSYLRTWKWAGGWVIDREDARVIQGNRFANWLVENPA
ncbi:hypothetical protein [Streptomyces sp. NPDC058657]|uniref:hypothetical protein n=1 Tax=unclassified Streptomyces TaxID=2593676 RepID=UPI0036488926